ncbi:MAG: hypothetical protein EG824_08465 [Deltaproteobacteria bacterium]|nr:hypothetical protein [Deltaproteobacteria bacterium]
MMRMIIAVTLFTVWTVVGVAFAGEEYKNFTITIDGKSYDLNLNEEIQVMDKIGKTATIVVRKKPYAEYTDQVVSFQHGSELSVSSQDLGDGIKQLMSATATGTLIMIQEYSTMDPSMLVPVMLNELTKESVDYGYSMTQEKVTRKLKSGILLNGLKATLNYKGDESCWEVLSFGKKDAGILVVTQIDKKFIKTDIETHNHFWNTLELKF